MVVVTTRSPEETVELGKKVGKLLRAGDFIACRGGMGAGKTAFTRGIALGMGLPDVVSSPTFALVNEYRDAGKTLYHFDMYRVTTPEALETTGFFDYLEEDGVIVCEWTENILPYLPERRVTVTIEGVGDSRTITIEGDERFDSIGN